MKPFSLVALAGAACLLGSAAAADETPGTPQIGAAPPASAAAQSNAYKEAHASNQVICKREDSTGSRLEGHKECHTRAEWDDIWHSSARTTDSMERGDRAFSPK